MPYRDCSDSFPGLSLLRSAEVLCIEKRGYAHCVDDFGGRKMFDNRNVLPVPAWKTVQDINRFDDSRLAHDVRPKTTPCLAKVFDAPQIRVNLSVLNSGTYRSVFVTGT